MYINSTQLNSFVSVGLLTAMLILSPSTYALGDSTSKNLFKDKCRFGMDTPETGLICSIKDRELVLTKVKSFPRGSKAAADTNSFVYSLMHRYILLGGKSITIIDEQSGSIKHCNKAHIGFDVIC